MTVEFYTFIGALDALCYTIDARDPKPDATPVKLALTELAKLKGELLKESEEVTTAINKFNYEMANRLHRLSTNIGIIRRQAPEYGPSVDRMLQNVIDYFHRVIELSHTGGSSTSASWSIANIFTGTGSSYSSGGSGS
jgi:uncharacterized membrane protein YgcG